MTGVTMAHPDINTIPTHAIATDRISFLIPVLLLVVLATGAIRDPIYRMNSLVLSRGIRVFIPVSRRKRGRF
jgi:hypothetical protein